MIIQSSQIGMSSQHQFKQLEAEQENLRYWDNRNRRGDAELAASGLEFKSDKISIRFSQEQFENYQATQQISETSALEHDEELEDIKHGWKLNLLRRLVENLTGKQIKIVKTSDLKTESVENLPSGQVVAEQASAPEEMEGWGLEYHYQHSYTESERTTFSAQGQVLTADGREININVGLSMSRSFSSHENIDIRAGDALKDPLVINYAGTAAQLEETDLHFDLDLDGNADQMQFVSSGSGFLALDKNGDGQINDGSELFGPRSGDGFEELGASDSVGNKWRGKNASIYDQLRIWERDADGSFNLLALGQRGIGAIYLDRVETPFSVKDAENNQQGEVRSTGLFLHESGLAGTIQQLDLVV